MARLQMKSKFLPNALVCISLFLSLGAGNTTGKQGLCANPGTPININVGSCAGAVKGEKGDRGASGAKGVKGDSVSTAACKCDLQNAKKPSAHIEANKGDAAYRNNQVIKDWSVRAPNSHITGGMTYKDGQLTVPIAGRYYIYAQFYYHHSGRIFLRINNKRITMLQPPAPYRSGQHGIVYTGGVFQLKAGDVITALATSIHGTVRGHVNSYHSYLGAFLI